MLSLRLGAQPLVYRPYFPISPRSHSNKTWTVAVPTGQNWVTIPREQLTTSDKLLVWMAKAGQPLWPPIFVNLETRSNGWECRDVLCVGMCCVWGGWSWRPLLNAFPLPQ